MGKHYTSEPWERQTQENVIEGHVARLNMKNYLKNCGYNQRSASGLLEMDA
jgi:hypothetical protein